MPKNLPKTLYVYEVKPDRDEPYLVASETAEGCSPDVVGEKRVVGFYKLAEELTVTNAALVSYRRKRG